jgi:restriction system protein
MAVPEFNEIKAPAMQFFADGNPHRVSEVYDVLAKHFNLTEQDLNEVLPSGTQRRWHNRANWACYDLFRAGLLERPKRGLYVITETGRKVAEQKPKFIGRNFLMQFPQFVEFAQASGPKKEIKGDIVKTDQEADSVTKSKTPEELIGSAYEELEGTSN